jgi:hypothetical protein
MYLDGELVIDSDNIGQHYSAINSPPGGNVSYVPPNPLGSGEHIVEIIFSHWADNPPESKTTQEVWTFNVP